MYGGIGTFWENLHLHLTPTPRRQVGVDVQWNCGVHSIGVPGILMELNEGLRLKV